jgi:hypothetical protein
LTPAVCHSVHTPQSPITPQSPGASGSNGKLHKKTGFFGRTRSVSPPKPPKVQAHQTHPHQPSPSPAQLNNPGIYVAPPPPSGNSPRFGYNHQAPRPTSTYHTSSRPGYQPPPQHGGPAFPTPSLAPPPAPPRPSSADPSLYGAYAPPHYAANMGTSAPGWPPQAPKPLTPSNVVSGLMDMIHRKVA